MNNEPPLHSAIVSMVSLAAGIAARHPDMGLCQLRRLRELGIPENQVATVIEVARHIRDEATEKLDAAFDAEAFPTDSGCCVGNDEVTPVAESCCGTTARGQSCC